MGDSYCRQENEALSYKGSVLKLEECWFLKKILIFIY